MRMNTGGAARAIAGMRRAVVLALLAGAMGLASVEAQAAYPERPIQLVMPFSAGGFNDTVSRIVADALGKVLGASVVVENRTGGAGVVGATYVAGARPDGYTVLVGGPTVLVVLPMIDKTIPFDPQKSFAPVGFMTSYDMLAVTAPATGFKTLGALVQGIKAMPDKLTYASAGLGTPLQLAGAWLAHVAGGKIEAINYRGSSTALVDTIAGRVTYLFTTPEEAAQHIRNGSLIGLAVASDKRSAALPDVPTMREAGLPGFMQINWSPWNALFVPRNTPPDIVATLNAALQKVMADPEVAKRVSDIGGTNMGGMSVQAATAFYNSEFDRWRPALRDLDMLAK